MQSNRMNAKYYLNTLVRFSSFQKCDIQGSFAGTDGN